MRGMRDSTAGLMGLVLIAALALAALKTESKAWAGSTLLATLGILGLCAVGVFSRGAPQRPAWLGAAVFGWGYLAMAFALVQDSRTLPTITALDSLWTAFELPVPAAVLVPGQDLPSFAPNFELTGHCLWALAAATLGGSISAWLFAQPNPSEPAAGVPESATAPISSYRPLVASLAGLAVVALTAAAGVGLKPGLWAGLTFLCSCACLGLLLLFAILSPRDRRAIWVGPALFGLGYLIPAFEWRPDQTRWPPLPTVLMIEGPRPAIPMKLSGYPFLSDGRTLANARILKTLETPIPMHFPNETPLADVLNSIAETTAKRDGVAIPFFVDPVGLSEAEQSLNSKVVVNLDDVPLKHALRLCLKQLDLDYCVTGGYVKVTDPANIGRPAPGLDPFMIVCQSLLSLVAAAAGAVASLIIIGLDGPAARRGGARLTINRPPISPAPL